MPTNSPGKPRQACRRAGGSHLNITCALLEMPKLFKLPGSISQIGLPPCLSPQCEEGNSEAGEGGRARSCPRECHRDQWWIAGQRRNLGDSPVGTDFPSSLLLPYAPPFSVPKERRLRLFWTMVKGKAFMPPDLKLSWDLGPWGLGLHG